MYNGLLRQKESVLSFGRGEVRDLQKWNGRRTILKGGLVIDPKNKRKDQFDIVVEEDTIFSIEKNEKKNTIVGPFSRPPKYLTKVYAAPAHKAEETPTREGITVRLKVGLIINKLPKNATHKIITCFFVIFSFKNKKENITTKKGERLFNMLASESISLSIA